MAVDEAAREAFRFEFNRGGMMTVVAAVLVNYNGGPELRQALQSIVEEMGATAWEAVVVDNASTDGSDAIASEFGSHVRLLRNEQNVGFSRAVNQGIAMSQA